MKQILITTLLGVVMLVGPGIQTTQARKIQNDTIKVLAIGNSFSVDAMEEHLSDLAQAAGLATVLGNMYIGGCPIDRHVKNLREDIADYSYRKFDPKGNRQETKDFTLEKALADEDWDYVTVQQSSPNSGLPETYALLPELVEYIHLKAPGAIILFHQTWAYSPDSKHKHFGRYGKDQLKMYSAICDAVQSEIPKAGIRLVIPSGTAIQNARTSFLGTDLTRDGYHLSRLHGRYIASCTWLEAVLGKNPVGNPHCPEGMTEKECRTAQKAAHKAIKRPFKISVIK